MSDLPVLDPVEPAFPCPTRALSEPDGLLAAGGNLTPSTLLAAYRQGIFPWFDDDQPILWWSPSVRAVIEPGGLHISRSLKKLIRSSRFGVTSDQAFAEVINHCAGPRRDNNGAYSDSTWITLEMQQAYNHLHRLGFAHSVEVWLDDKLVGGLYGIAVGGIFCGESMFSHQASASKVALAALANNLFDQGFSLIDCQISNPHLTAMGAVDMSRDNYLLLLEKTSQVAISWPDISGVTSD